MKRINARIAEGLLTISALRDPILEFAEDSEDEDEIARVREAFDWIDERHRNFHSRHGRVYSDE